MLSKYCSDIANKYGIKIGGVNKLVPNIGNKSKYVVHYRNLQSYLSLGIKLSKIHRILTFKQSDCLKKYIDFNTDKIKNAVNCFEKDFFKLMNNSVFGKTMENVRNRISVKLINNSKDYVIKFNARLLFTDTDSLVHEIKKVDVYEDFYKDKHLFDFSDYPLNSKFFDPVNKKVISKMKDEFKGKNINEFVGLKSKMYSLISVDDEEITKAKRVNKKIKQRIC